jgi:NAD(P)H-hydrate epimerase
MPADATFVTDDGQPVPAVTTAEMREVDRVAVEGIGPELLQMMENAGRTLAGFVRALTDDPVVVLAGDGGNGGGGLCAARHLANHGRDVRVGLDRPAEALTGAAATQCRTLRGTAAGVTDGETGERAETETETGVAPLRLDDAGVVVDAIVGYGLRGAPRGRARERIDDCNRTETPVLSLDVPSGVDATTGERPGAAVDADHVLTLALPKPGLAGESDLWLADIGIPRAVYRDVGIDYQQPFSGRARVPLTTAEAHDSVETV